MVNISLLFIFLCITQAGAEPSGNASSGNQTVAFLSRDNTELNLTRANDDGFELCLYGREDFLCDPDNLLNDRERARIDSELKTIEAMTRQNESTHECRKQGMIIKLMLFDSKQESINELSNNQSLLQRWNSAYECARIQLIFYTARDKDARHLGSLFMMGSWEKLIGVGKEKIYDGLQTVLNEIKATVSSQFISMNNSLGIPKPYDSDFWLCGLQEPGFVCNPDRVLTENERSQLDHELKYLKERTKVNDSTEECTKAGVNGIIAAIERNITFDIAVDLIATWKLDQVCRQSLVIVYSPASVRFSAGTLPYFPKGSFHQGSFIKGIFSQQYEISGGANVNGLMNVTSIITYRAIENMKERISSEKSADLWLRWFDNFHFIVLVIGLFGNVICLVTMLFCKALSENMINKYLLVLLLSDTLYCLWMVGLEHLYHRILSLGSLDFWPCIIANFINHSTVCASSNVIVLLTLERFFAIMFPLQHMRYHHINRLLLVLIGLLPMQLWTVYFDLQPYIHSEYTVAFETYCKELNYRGMLHPTSKVYIPFYISLVILPLFSAIFVNTIILIKLKRLPNLQGNTTPAAISTRAKSDDSHRILWILPLIYIILTTPNVVFNLATKFYSWDNQHGIVNAVHTLFYHFFLLEFIYNWFFYAMASSTFRKAFISFWSKKFNRIRIATSPVSRNNSKTLYTSRETSRETQQTDL
ncbi:modulator of levamisole receptor-1 domain-containing protein [Ditylenchus destructor]|nr:modulator of levamisole receptor-1 domain-containing protein [Ditylenchus destructor]